MLAQSVGKTLIIRSIRVNTSKKKVSSNTHYIQSMKASRFLYFNLNSKVIITNTRSITQVTDESDHISLLRHSTMSDLFFVFYIFYYNLLEKNHRRKISSKKKFLREINVIIILIWQKLGSVGPAQQKIKLPLPYLCVCETNKHCILRQIFENGF